MNELALFAGAGGGILGGKLLGWRTVCAVEWEPYPASVLCARQNDGFLPPFPIWDDVQTFDGHPWRGIVDVISGGFPCQDISAAGKGDGLDGERSGMWRHMARVVGEVRPRFVFVENSPMLTTRGGTRVVGDLAALGYDCKWTVMGAADVGANHQRNRMWIVARQRKLLSHTEHNGSGWGQQQSESIEKKNDVANTNGKFNAMRGDSENYEKSMVEWRIQSGRGLSYSGKGCEEVAGQSAGMALSKCSGLEGQRSQSGQQEVTEFGDSSALANTQNKGDVWRQWVMGFAEQEHHQGRSQADGSREWWEAEPNVGRVADGVAARVDRLKAIGNGQVPLCAAEAWRLLAGAFK